MRVYLVRFRLRAPIYPDPQQGWYIAPSWAAPLPLAAPLLGDLTNLVTRIVRMVVLRHHIRCIVAAPVAAIGAERQDASPVRVCDSKVSGVRLNSECGSSASVEACRRSAQAMA